MKVMKKNKYPFKTEHCGYVVVKFGVGDYQFLGVRIKYNSQSQFWEFVYNDYKYIRCTLIDSINCVCQLINEEFAFNAHTLNNKSLLDIVDVRKIYSH